MLSIFIFRDLTTFSGLWEVARGGEKAKTGPAMLSNSQFLWFDNTENVVIFHFSGSDNIFRPPRGAAGRREGKIGKLTLPNPEYWGSGSVSTPKRCRRAVDNEPPGLILIANSKKWGLCNQRIDSKLSFLACLLSIPNLEGAPERGEKAHPHHIKKTPRSLVREARGFC